MFIGLQKIKTEIDLGDGKIKYILENDSGDTVTKEQFESMSSETAYEDGFVRVRKWNPALEKIMPILLENDLKLIEKDFVTGRIDETIVDSYRKAAAQVFGSDFEHNITLSQIHKVLTGKDKIMAEEVTPEVVVETPPVEPVVEPVVEAPVV